jgi:hypothetical protein
MTLPPIRSNPSQPVITHVEIPEVAPRRVADRIREVVATTPALCPHCGQTVEIQERRWVVLAHPSTAHAPSAEAVHLYQVGYLLRYGDRPSRRELQTHPRMWSSSWPGHPHNPAENRRRASWNPT